MTLVCRRQPHAGPPASWLTLASYNVASARPEPRGQSVLVVAVEHERMALNEMFKLKKRPSLDYKVGYICLGSYTVRD